MTQNQSGIKVVILVVIATLIGGILFAQDPHSAKATEKTKAAADDSGGKTDRGPAETAGSVSESGDVSPSLANRDRQADPANQEKSTAPPLASPKPGRVTRQSVIASVTIFVLAVFVGFEVITKVPPTLHTPLMSGSNAISGITLVGAVLVAATMTVPGAIGFVAVTLATINAVGGFLVTHRMLAMFSKR